MELDMNLTNKQMVFEPRKNKVGFYKKIVVDCCDCKKTRLMRVDAWKIRKTDRCHSCSARNSIKPNITHGCSKDPIYKKYMNICYRCFNPNAGNFKYYGGKGISVCMEWIDPQNGFYAFKEWAENNGWKQDLEIDRIDPEGDYCPENCQFISRVENVARMRNLFGVEGRTIKKWKGVALDKLLSPQQLKE